MIGLLCAVCAIGVICSSLQGCGAFKTGIQPLDNLNDKQKAILYGNVWNAQFDSAEGMKADWKNLTPTQKKMARGLSAILTESRPWLDTYTTFADTGAIPPDDIARNLANAITKIIKLAAGEGI